MDKKPNSAYFFIYIFHLLKLPLLSEDKHAGLSPGILQRRVLRFISCGLWWESLWRICRCWPYGFLYDYAVDTSLLSWETDCTNELWRRAPLSWSWSIPSCDWSPLYGWSPLDVIFSLEKNDNFLLFMDPFDDRRMDFPLGQMPPAHNGDGIMSKWRQRGSSWIIKWHSQSHQLRRQVDLLKQPFHSKIDSLTKKGFSEWGELTFLGSIWRDYEKIRLALPFHVQFPSASLALYWNSSLANPPPPAGANVSVIPYCLGKALPRTLKMMGIMSIDERWVGCKNRLDFFLSLRSNRPSRFLRRLK